MQNIRDDPIVRRPSYTTVTSMLRVYVGPMKTRWLLLQTLSSYEPKLLVFVGFLVISLTLWAPIILPPFLQQDSVRLPQCLAVGLCNCFHQLLDEGSLVTIGVVTNLITGDGQFRLPIPYC